jgi:hypothetical protein
MESMSPSEYQQQLQATISARQVRVRERESSVYPVLLLLLLLLLTIISIRFFGERREEKAGGEPEGRAGEEGEYG